MAEIKSAPTAVENQDDEQQILNDQDMTTEKNISDLDENMGAKSRSVDTLEDEPADFMRGEVDVKTQMDRAARHLSDLQREVPEQEEAK